MLSNDGNVIWIYFTDEITFLGHLSILIIFRHIEMVNNYLQTLVNSNRFKDIVGNLVRKLYYVAIS